MAQPLPERIRLVSKAEISERTSLSLIPSENTLSPLAASCYSSRLQSRYMLSLPGIPERCPGRNHLVNVMHSLNSLLVETYSHPTILFKALSGLQQMHLILQALRPQFSSCLLIQPEEGGHASTAQMATALDYAVGFLRFDWRSWDIDLDHYSAKVKALHSRRVLVYLDHTIAPTTIDVESLCSITPDHWCVFYDISHPHAFFATGTIPRLVPSRNFFFGGSTHKTIPGPQKAVLVCPTDDSITKELQNTMEVFVSSLHTGSCLAMLVTFEELRRYGASYASHVLRNARQLSATLSKHLPVLGPGPYGTNTHQVLVGCRGDDHANRLAEKLAACGIVAPPMRMPSTKSTGLRLGVQEATRFGMGTEEMEQLGQLITECWMDRCDNVTHVGSALCRRFSTPQYCFEGKSICP